MSDIPKNGSVSHRTSDVPYPSGTNFEHIYAGAAGIEHIHAARPVQRLALTITGAIVLMVVGAGVALVWVGATGHTELTLFGNTFKSETVGAVGIFCGAVIVILNVRRVMKSLERLGALPDKQD
jgi:hypothetical protein